MAHKDILGGKRFAPPGPADRWYSITPSDTDELHRLPRAIYVGGAGDVTAKDRSGAEATFVGMEPGNILPIRARWVMATGTTATNLVALV